MTPPRTPSWKHLWQPRRGVFWLMVAFNVLSSLMAWTLRTVELSALGLAVLGPLALVNSLAGLWLAARLWRGD